MMDWPNGLPEIILSSPTIEVSKEQLQEEVNNMNKDASSQSIPVIVERLDLRWLFAQKKNFIAFSTILTVMPVGFYSSKFISVILNKYWD